MAQASTSDLGFAARLRSRTAAAHRDAEGSPFIDALTHGTLPLPDYARFLRQLFVIYTALEQSGRLRATDPTVVPFLDDGLLRVPELSRDLAYIDGPDWELRINPLPATTEYANRITEASVDSAAGFIAHHYLRYLGDLSGGQIMRRAVERAYGFTTDGVRFFRFDAIPNAKPFKDAYRRHLDTIQLTDAEQELIIAEANLGFAHNRALFVELGQTQ
ncbi:biliverdin-producing heme oxygenase [Hoyosella rhizosphaerae]|uniref:Heme oxygenase n=1 Tax=Hoyosella rhizosphaerae TaxID=1755582 RepID=A0A916TZI1_9ACTN|nr:biliverdin-producing heme oxygenase [Hoyosella rhizosphaerae]MBN4927223.1 biliverdin-producing heme oxygenase [Hoyosella rhizosphaerae]GGC53033.1 heme oxygenase [Hoyosella rhizosphaerae]